MKAFSGFPPGPVVLVELPEPLFSDLLPLIDDLNELKLTLHCYWHLSRAKGQLRFIRRQDLMHDEQLLAGLGTPDAAVIGDALEHAVARGSLLHVHVAHDPQSGETLEQDWYFANTPKGRAATQSLAQGQWPQAWSSAQQADVQRPNIFGLYEQSIGLLQPLIADELRQAEREYPAEWIQEAFQIAAAANVRRWSYVKAILERWTTEGKTDGVSKRDSEQERRRYVEGKYADHIQS